MNAKKELTELATIILEVFDDPSLCEITEDHTAEVLMENGYRKAGYVATDIFEEIENYIIDECFMTDPAVADIYRKLRAMRKKYIPPTPFERLLQKVQAIGTAADIEPREDEQ